MGACPETHVLGGKGRGQRSGGRMSGHHKINVIQNKRVDNINLVRDMQFLFGFSLPSELWSKRVKSFDVKYATCGGRFVSYGL